MLAQRTDLKPFHKERFASINKEASRYDQPPRLRLQRNGAIFLMRSHPALQRWGIGSPSTSSSLRHVIPSTCSPRRHVLPFDIFTPSTCSRLRHVHAFDMFIPSACSRLRHVHPSTCSPLRHVHPSTCSSPRHVLPLDMFTLRHVHLERGCVRYLCRNSEVRTGNGDLARQESTGPLSKACLPTIALAFRYTSGQQTGG